MKMKPESSATLQVSKELSQEAAESGLVYNERLGVVAKEYQKDVNMQEVLHL